MRKGSSLCLTIVLFGILCSTSLANLTLNIPNTITITGSDFEYLLVCSKNGKEVPCQTNGLGLPNWMTLENNVLSVK